METSLKVKCWGTRSWISTPSLQTREHGGNTTCMQLLYGDILLGIDAGFGICNWGEELAQRIVAQQESLEIHLFFTRFHWDHIQGLPFFHPIYSPTTRLFLYAPHPKAYTQDKLEVLFSSTYSPFSGLASMQSQIEIIELQDAVTVGGLRMEVESAPDAQGHPYRCTAPDGKSVLIAAPGDHLLPFAAQADLLILDAVCSENEEKAGYPGWGGGTYEEALSLAQRCEAKSLLCTHHGPYRTDKELHRLGAELGFVATKEGVIYSV